MGRHDAIAMDEMAHSSMQEAAKIARANGTKVEHFLRTATRSCSNKRSKPCIRTAALVCIDGVYSMSGKIPPMRDLAVAQAQSAVLYIDDARRTGVLGEAGRGTVLENLGSYDNAVVGLAFLLHFRWRAGLSGAQAPFFSGWCSRIRSSPYGYSAARSFLAIWKPSASGSTSCSSEYARFGARLDRSIARLTGGLAFAGDYEVMGATSIVSVKIEDEADTPLRAGKFLFDHGYYVQSVVFPAVPYHAGVLRGVQRQPRRSRD